MTSASVDAATVSVVIPTRNGGARLMETLASVFAQTYRPLEVIVVDDGSTDETGGQLQRLASAARLVVVTQPQGGTANARNTGVQTARGSLVALLDHDDLWPPDKIAWQVQVLAGRPDAVVAYGYMESFGLERSYRWPGPDGPDGDVTKAFRRKNWIRSPGQTLIRADALRAVGGFDASLVGADDWDLYLKLADRGPFAYGHRLALRYRVHRGNQSRRAWTMFRHAWRVHRRHAGAWPPAAPGACARWLQCRGTLVHMLVRDVLAGRR